MYGFAYIFFAESPRFVHVFPIFNQENLFPIYPVRIGINHSHETVQRPSGLCFNQIFYVCDGCGYLKTDSKNYTLNKGDMFFIKKNVPHSYGRSGNFTASYFGYDGEFCEIYTHFLAKRNMPLKKTQRNFFRA